MTLNYTWTIEDAEAHPSVTINGTTYNNVVHTVHWRLRARDLDNSDNVKTVTWPDGSEHRLEVDVYGDVRLDTSDPGKEQFIDADDLDNRTLAHWASVAMDAQEDGTVQGLKQRLAANLEAIKQPSSVSLNLTGEVDDSDV